MLSEIVLFIVAPVISTLFKLVFTNAAPCRFVPDKSTPGPIMYPPDAVVVT